MTDENIGADSLTASLQSVERSDDKLAVVVRLSNAATRALHYIADVRATRYDPGSRTLTLSLSDEGREIIPGTIGKLPVFRYVDPGSDAEITLSVPDRVIRFSRTAPPGELAFESHQLSEVDEVVVEVAWADVPYYEDTRVTDDRRLPAVRWQQHKAQATRRLSSGEKKKLTRR